MADTVFLKGIQNNTVFLPENRVLETVEKRS